MDSVLGYQIIESRERLNWDWGKVNSKESLVYTIEMLLVLPFLEIIIRSGPFYAAVKKKGWVMILILLLALALEFAVGWFATNQTLIYGWR